MMSSGLKQSQTPRQRNGSDRLRAIPDALRRGEEFRSRVAAAKDDLMSLADLMAESIEMNRGSRGLEIVGRDGRSTVCFEEIDSYHCMDAARSTYLCARGGKNAPVGRGDA
jgi:hypothetical protein